MANSNTLVIGLIFLGRGVNQRKMKESKMDDHVYKTTELVGSSKTSMEDAVANALARAKKTVKNMRWFEVVQTRGHIVNGEIDHWQVAIKLGFTLED